MGHVITNMVLHEFGHQAVDCTSGCSEALENVGTTRILIQRSENRLKLTNHFLGSVDEI